MKRLRTKGSTDKVPKPKRSDVAGSVESLEHPLPSKTIAEYESFFRHHQRVTDALLSICSLCRFADLQNQLAYESIRMLRNLNLFVADRVARDARRPDSAPLLQSVCLGHDFGGIGVSKSRKGQYERWEANEQELTHAVDRIELNGRIERRIAAIAQRK